MQLHLPPPTPEAARMRETRTETDPEMADAGTRRALRYALDCANAAGGSLRDALEQAEHDLSGAGAVSIETLVARAIRQTARLQTALAAMAPVPDTRGRE